MKKINVSFDAEIMYEYDVVVAGGGIAGIAAALSAARHNKKVLLIEKQFMIGGLATAGLVTIYLPLCDGCGNQVSYGIVEELFRLSVKHFAEGKWPGSWMENRPVKTERFEVQFNPHMFVLETEKLLQNEGVKILYGTSVISAAVKDGKLSALIIENKSGVSAVCADTFIDATGDADLCAMAGEKTALYSRKNILASWYYSSNGAGPELRMLGVAEDPEVPDKPLINKRYTGIDGDEISEMITDAHSQMLIDILNARKEKNGYVPVTIASIPQLRMTRRLVGGYELDLSDDGKKFETSIGVISNWKKAGPVYTIPFECLHGSRIKNLITAGRCISVTDDMWDVSRVIPACAVTGQAAGLAAAMTNDFTSIDISALRTALKADGAAV